MSQPSLGVMALYLDSKRRLEERDLFRKLTIQGSELGLDVFVFTPQDVISGQKRIRAHVYDPKTRKWTIRSKPFPDVIFDRCRYQPTARFQQLKQFRARYPQLNYMNRPLANKWVVHQLFAADARIRPHLPKTRIYDSNSELIRFTNAHRVVFLKPVNGTGGRGILRVEQKQDRSYSVQGRDANRRIIRPRTITRAQFGAGMKVWTGKYTYLMQQGLNLRLSNGRVHDYRLLIQKNGSGEWEITGGAGRVGPSKSVTSNLHGGGTAVPMNKLLGYWFTRSEAESIKQKAYRLCFAAVERLETKYGSLCELALDIAVERSGRVWLLEVNPKPGREVFAQIGEPDTYKKAVRQPLLYALWLHSQKNAKSSR